MNLPLFLLLIFSFFFSLSTSSNNSTTNIDVTRCLKEFYTVAFNGDYSCTKGFDIFSLNSMDVFKNGKSCFLEVAKEECSSKQYDFLSKNYDQFLEVMTTKPLNDSNCTSTYYKYNAQKCLPMKTDIAQKVLQMPAKVNDTAWLELINSCDRVKACLDENCYFDEKEKIELNEYCEIIELGNTEFSMCQKKILKEYPDLSKYNCLEGFDFLNSTMVSEIEKYTEKAECTKSVFSAPLSNSTNVDVSSCLHIFFKAVLNYEYNCTEGYQFLDNNSSFLRESFTSGKPCFLEVVKEECTSKQFDFMNTHYEDLLEALSTKPFNESDFTNLYYKYNAIRCGAMMDGIPIKMSEVPDRNLKINDSKVMELIDLCENTKICMDQNSLFQEDCKKSITEYCEMIELTNTQFSICQQKMSRELPDLSQYACLKGFDFYKQSTAFLKEKYTTKKECTKQIMEKICGKIEDFDRNSKIFVKNLGRLDEMNANELAKTE